MNKHKLTIIITIVGLFLLIMTATIIELNKVQKEKEYKYAIKQIETATIKCINDKKCKMGKITINELIKKEYLENIKNPKTKENFNKKSYIVYPDLAFYDIEE